MILSINISPISNIPIVSVEEAKRHCNCDVSTWDVDFVSWINAATRALESWSNTTFTPSTVKLLVKQNVIENTDNYIELPFYNNAKLKDGSVYTLMGRRIYTNDELVEIEYTCGSEPTDAMKHAVKMYVADLYENRGESKQGETPFKTSSSAEIGEQAKRYYAPFSLNATLF